MDIHSSNSIPITNNQTLQLSTTPILLPNLRSALSHLYSSASSLHTTSQAHTYLIEFQSRNIRRKIHALVQRQNDKSNGGNNGNSNDDVNQFGQVEQVSSINEARRNVLLNHSGSSFYASLSLLLTSSISSSISNHSHNGLYGGHNHHQQHHETEQLFCAQTILQRLRKVKLSDAIDIEMEYISLPDNMTNTSTSTNTIINPISYVDFISKCNTYQINEQDAYIHWKNFVSFHCQQILTFFQHSNPESGDTAAANATTTSCNYSGFISLLNRVLQHYFDEQWNDDNSNAKNVKNFYDPRWGYGCEIEEKIKGELILLVLTTITYYNMYVQLLLAKQEQLVMGKVHTTTSSRKISPLMNTLTSAIAVIALRLRYTSTSVKNDQTLVISSDTTVHSLLNEQQQQQQLQSDVNIHLGATNDTPILTTILRALELVSQIATSLSIQELVPTIQSNEMCSIDQLHKFLSQQTIHQCIYTQLSILPDALLGGNTSGGIRGRLSIDPKCIQFMNVELSNPVMGIQVVMDTLRIILEQEQQSQHQHQSAPDPESQRMFLLTCQRWASSVPLPNEFVEHTLLYAINHILPRIDSSNTTLIQNAFCSYLISIFESACLTVEQIVALNVGLSLDSSGISGKVNPKNKPGRKRQSSKSKKRHKEKINVATSNSNVNHQEKAEAEHHHRGMVACHAAMLSWEILYQMFKQCLSVSSNENDVAEGDGPVGCMCALVSAVLPYVLKNQKQDQDSAGILLFVSNVMEALTMICSDTNPSVRALSFEHIPIIHSAVVNKTSSEAGAELTEIDVCIAKNVAICAISLAEQCAYPSDYFVNLALDNNEELEIERNDVRDVLRSVTNVDENVNLVPLQMLDYVLEFCHNKITSSDSSILAPETVVHILSSPAKSLECLARVLPNFIGDPRVNTIQQIMHRAIDSLLINCTKVLGAFQHGISLNQVFPITRLVCICLASWSPLFSSLKRNEQYLRDDIQFGLQEVLGTFFSVAIENLIHIPELVDYSSIEDTVYDIRGAMRSPGGEDHVSVIALMRMVTEGDNISIAALRSAALKKGGTMTDIFLDLSRLHDRLQAIELERGQGVLFGKGITAKSRRVLLKSICHIGVMISRTDPSAEEIIRSELFRLFRHPLSSIIAAASNPCESQAFVVHCLTQGTNDIASFPPDICSQLFQNSMDSNNEVLKGTQIIINTVVTGYKDFMLLQEPSDVAVEWGRMRGALLSLFRSCVNPNLPQLAVEAIIALNDAECKSVLEHTSTLEKQFTSSIFTASVVSEEVIPAGAFLIALRDVVDKALKKTDEFNADQLFQVVSTCTAAMYECHEIVFQAVQSKCPSNIRWDDPRTTISEAWFSTVTNLLIAFKTNQIAGHKSLEYLVGSSMSLCINLILSTKVEKEYAVKDHIEDGVVSVEGPQSLAMIDFLALALVVDDIFTLTATHCQGNLTVDYNSLERGSDPSFAGSAIIAATILRAASGGLPPWTVEFLPSILTSLYQACGSVDNFVLAIAGGCDVRLCKSSASKYNDITPGKKLAGFFLDTMKLKARDYFLCNIRETFVRNENDQNQLFRYLKVLIKANCGGKKKATGFTLKPQPTPWECDRL